MLSSKLLQSESWIDKPHLMHLQVKHQEQQES